MTKLILEDKKAKCSICVNLKGFLDAKGVSKIRPCCALRGLDAHVVHDGHPFVLLSVSSLHLIPNFSTWRARVSSRTASQTVDSRPAGQ